VEAVRRVLNEEADWEALELRDFACTMLVAIVSVDLAAFWQIGKGAICFREAASDKYTCMYWPERATTLTLLFSLPT
jgi:hypothetical protein